MLEVQQCARRSLFATAVAAVVIGFLIPSTARAGFEDRVFRDEFGDHKYVVFVPENYSKDRSWPVVMYLHGAGERGSDGHRQTTVGLGPAIRRQAASFPFIAVFPQCEDVDSRFLAGWLADTADAKRALKILADVEGEFSVDAKRRILTGWSMGGYGAWSVAASDPARWSAVVPLSGGGEPAQGASLKDVPVWAFHGANDAAIRPQQSRNMIAAIRESGGVPRYTEIADGGHDISRPVYGSAALISWMQDPTRAAPTALSLSAGSEDGEKDTTPFVPAVELSGAVSVRLGNRMLDALAMAIPDLLPKDIFSGSINDIYDATVVDGYRFKITFGNIAWSAKPWRIRMKGYDKQRLNVQISVKDARLRIGGTSVVGSSHSASAGPIDVIIGHRYPVWLSFDVEPFIKERRLRLKLHGSRFDIPNDNWYVTAPAGVTTRGLGITRRKVSNGLVNGLYGSKARIEQEVTSVVPALVKEMESRLELNQADSLVSSFWPLPVYKPRVRLWPQDVITDDKGVSVVLGVTAASMSPDAAPESPEVVKVTELSASEIVRSEDLNVKVAPDMLGHLSKLLIDAKVANIHVLDIPEESFARFAEIDSMTRCFPGLQASGENLEVRTVLGLLEPIRVRDAEESQRFVFSAPKLGLGVSVRKRGDSEWTRYADVFVGVDQKAGVSLAKSGFSTRKLQLEWQGDPSLTLSTVAADASSSENLIDDASLKSLFLSSWNRWTGQGPAAQTTIPDLDLGMTKLRLSDAGWKAPFLGVTFSPPGVKITNSAKVPLVYETKGPFSDWGGPYTLEPGSSHHYEITHPLTYRRRVDARLVEYLLETGSHSEFRIPQSGGSPQLFRAREDLETEHRDDATGDDGEPAEGSKTATAEKIATKK